MSETGEGTCRKDVESRAGLRVYEVTNCYFAPLPTFILNPSHRDSSLTPNWA